MDSLHSVWADFDIILINLSLVFYTSATKTENAETSLVLKNYQQSILQQMHTKYPPILPSPSRKIYLSPATSSRYPPTIKQFLWPYHTLSNITIVFGMLPYTGSKKSTSITAYYNHISTCPLCLTFPSPTITED